MHTGRACLWQHLLSILSADLVDTAGNSVMDAVNILLWQNTGSKHSGSPVEVRWLCCPMERGILVP